uniref:Uncharacterized protein n=1 Tax=Anguilla anguilla TaxID=7936 RepID=A0A0E9RA30_ANGAN
MPLTHLSLCSRIVCLKKFLGHYLIVDWDVNAVLNINLDRSTFRTENTIYSE